MIVLDTNVVSEPFKAKPNTAVIKWLDVQEPQTLYITTITLAELLSGIHRMPPGRRRTELKLAIESHIGRIFEHRILHFDKHAAEVFGELNASALAAGNTMSFADCAIASIASAHEFALATRNVRDFKGTGIQMINPWDK